MSEYRDSFSETGWTRFLRVLSASFPIGRYFGVRVRVFWLTLLVMPLVLARTTDGLTFVEGLTWITGVTVLLYVTIWSHEMGHIVAGWRYGIRTPLITLSPLGGLAHMSQAAPDPKKEMIIAGAGPLVHVFWLALLWPLSHFLPAPSYETWAYTLTWTLIQTFVGVNIFLALFNLLPSFPLDGGRIFRAFLAGRMHPNRATLIAARVGIVGGALMILVGVILYFSWDDLYGLILVVIGISGIGACRAEIRAAQHSAGPYMQGEARQPWEMDPDAWKQGSGDGEGWKQDEDSSPGFFEKRRAAREEAAAEKAAAEDAELDAEVDRVLARVSEVGMDGLTKAERAILDRASARRRKD